MTTESDSAPVEADWPARLRELCHDLNNPLAVVMGQMEIMEERFKDLPDDVKRRHAEMLKAAQTMRELIMKAGGDARLAMGVEE